MGLTLPMRGRVVPLPVGSLSGMVNYSFFRWIKMGT